MKFITQKKTFIASGDADERKELESMLKSIGLCVVGAAENGTDAVCGVLACNADILVCDYLLPGEDGLDVCARLRAVKNPPATVILFPYISGAISARFSVATPDCVLLKPITPERLYQGISDSAAYRQRLSESRELSLEVRISGILRDLGIPVKLLGHRYIYDALLTVRQNRLCVYGAMDELYRYLALRHGSTPARVERNIRNAIEIAFDRCTPEMLEKYFGNTVRFDRGKPTNSEFLSCIAEKLTLETRGASI